MANPGTFMRFVFCCILVLLTGCATSGALHRNGLARYGENGDATYRIDVAGGHGSGFVVSTEGHIVTAYHVVEDEATVTISIMEGGAAPRTYTARVLATDETNDLALLQIDRRFRTPAVIGANDEAVAGLRVYNIGYPFSFGEMTGRGYIMRTGYSTAESSTPIRDVLLVDIPDGPGTSGSAVYAESSGRVIGVMRMMIAIGRRGMPPMVVRVLTPVAPIRAMLEANRVPYLRADGSTAEYPPLPPPAPRPAPRPAAAPPPSASATP